MEVNPLSIIFVKSDSKGDRLLFRYPYATDTKDDSNQKKCGQKNPYSVATIEDLLQTPLPQTSNIYKGQLTGFTDEMLSTLFAVKAELCNRKFELKVNDVRFVGHPTLLPYRCSKDDSASMILINIVFALHASASHSIVKCYYDLSKRLGKALRHEEKRCAYLSDEMKVMISAHDEVSALESESVMSENDVEEGNSRHSTGSIPSCAGILSPPKSAFHLIVQRSSLARSMETVFEDLSSTGVVQVRINKWVLLSFCLPHKAHQIHNRGLVIEPETIDKCLQRLRPYHGMLLMVNPNELLESIPLDGSAALLRVIKLYSPLKSLQTIAIEADLPLTQVFQMTGHLVYWAKATIIYPLCEGNVYVVSPGAAVNTHSPLADDFAKEFLGLCLLQVLAEFSLPAPLWYHARCSAGGGADGSRLARVVAWLLQRRLLLQLHTYVQFNTVHWGRDDDGKEYYCEKHGSFNKSLSESYSSLNQFQINNVPEPIEARNGHSEERYPTENYLNQTDFSHTRPIVIESDHTCRNVDDADSANHSFDDGIDVVEGFVDPKYLKGNNDIDTKCDIKDEQCDIIEKKTIGNSVDSGISSNTNGINGKPLKNGLNGRILKNTIDQAPSESTKTDLNCIAQLSSRLSATSLADKGHSFLKDDAGSEDSDHEMSPRQKSCNSLLNGNNTEKNGISLNLKIQNEMSFQPPTVVWSGAATGGCLASEACRPPPGAPGEEALMDAFTDEERLALSRIPAAHQPEDLALLAQLHKKGYFRGEQHLEEIMFLENLSRTQVLQLLDKFREVLITFETEDPAIAMLYSYQ